MSRLTLSSALFILFITLFAGSCANQSDTAQKEAATGPEQFERIVIFSLPPANADSEEGRAAMASEKGTLKEWMSSLKSAGAGANIPVETATSSPMTIVGSTETLFTFDLTQLGYSRGVALVRSGAQPKFLEGMVSADALAQEVKTYFAK